jgi:glycerol-3-phosphate dehydrogenase
MTNASSMGSLAQLAEASSSPFDLIVIGGGITGCGVALDAASRGLVTLLVEAEDLASGTSSASSKLVHGGLRYLESREFSLVAQALKERATLLRNAPHLVTPLAFTIPIFAEAPLRRTAKLALYDLTLWGYDLAGSLRSAPRHRRLSREQVISRLPRIQRDRLAGGLEYPDAFCDDARLTLELALTAARRYGATLLTYTKMERYSADRNGYSVQLTDRLTGAASEVRTRALVFATGVHAVDSATSGTLSPSVRIAPAKGVHIVVPRDRLPITAAAAVDVPNDGRRIFVVGWGDYTFIGTTDTPLDDGAPLEVDERDVAYLLDATNRAFESSLSLSDISGAWVGVRPLIAPAKAASTTSISRKHHLERLGSGLFLIAGGKLTTYRDMAEETVDAVVRDLGINEPCHTEHIRVLGALRPEQQELWVNRVELLLLRSSTQRDVTGVARSLVRRFGARATEAAHAFQHDDDFNLLPGGTDLRLGELRYMIAEEQVRLPQDVLFRRTRVGILDINRARQLADALCGPLASFFPEPAFATADRGSIEGQLERLMAFNMAKTRSHEALS